MRTAELSADETLVIKTAVLYAVRKLQARESEAAAIKVTTLAAEVITRLNEARMFATDVTFINACLSKFHEAWALENERAAMKEALQRLQNKLAGV